MAQNYTVRFKDGTVTTVQAVASITVVQEDVYDLSNYRNELDAAYVGRAWSAAGTGAEAQDDRFNAVVPFPEEKKRSRFKFWSQAGGAGDELFSGWCDRIEGYSIGTFTRV